MLSIRVNPTMWFKVYVALAAASLCIACMSIWLGSTLLTAHRESVLLHAEWAGRQTNLAELAGQAARAHRAISGEFDHQHREAALVVLRRAVVEFDLEVAECLDDVHAVPDAAISRLLAEGVRRSQRAMHQMARYGEGLFEALERGDLRGAGVSMANFNREYAEVQSALSPLRPAIRDSISHTFRMQLRESERMERRQYSIAGLMCIGVIVAFWYGRRLYEATTAAAREHEEFLAVTSERRDAAEAASRAKSEFLANMSHEIRTPMTAMLGYADLLADPGQSADERDRCIRTIRRSGEHLLAILNDILDLSKIEAGRMTLEQLDCSPVQLVEEVYSLVQPRALELGVSLRTQWSFPLPRTIQCDPLRLKQIVLNLVGNAVKFAPKGSVTVSVELRGEDRQMLAVCISDTGIGMTARQIDALFQPFTQGDGSTRRRFGGSGLGLSISRRLADIMGAKIDVESEVGRGSIFTLLMDVGPVAQENLISSLDDAVQRPLSASGEPVRLNGRILLAEDGPDNQRLITAFLTRAGAEVELAKNGQAAVDRALAPGAAFDLVLMDMQMPELDGYAAARLLRARAYRGPVLALTAHAMPGERERCIAAGCDDHVSKPIERQRFLETCQKWIERGRNAAAA